jgi:hypothetical protein
MSSLIVTPIKGRVVRVIKLDACGAPVTGASSAVDVADGFLTVHATPQYEDGTEFVKKRADGTLCVNQKDPGTLKRISAESSWCVLDPDLRVIMDGARLLNSGGATGTGAMFTDALVTNRFSLEIWQNVAGRYACDPTTGLQRYVYWAFPNCGNAQVQDFTAELDALEWHETFETQAAWPAWGTMTTPTGFAPSAYLGATAQIQQGDHYGYNVTTLAPPAATTGAVLLA